jgi:hypothetical protein
VEIRALEVGAGEIDTGEIATLEVRAGEVAARAVAPDTGDKVRPLVRLRCRAGENESQRQPHCCVSCPM